MTALGAVILAAGAGRRLGGAAKALLPAGGGATFLGRVIATARAVGLVDAVVVVGAPYGDAVGAHARDLGLRVAENPAPERGMASSISVGFAAIAAGPAAAAWLWPVDHADVTAVTLRALAAAIGHAHVARPRYLGRGGHPPLVARDAWGALAACAELPGGARAALSAAPAIDVAVDDPGVIADVDTPAELARRPA